MLNTHNLIQFIAKLQNTSKPESEQAKQNIRKKSPWDRIGVRKLTNRARETSNTSPVKTDSPHRDNSPKTDEKIPLHSGEKRAAKQRKPALKIL